MNLSLAEEGREYLIRQIETDDEELDADIPQKGYNGVEEKLKAAGIKDGDSVRICDYEFDYFE